ncbi:hypothetical protein [Chondromyces apiculatus]|uniref:Uncharacterized protein n=1 Tax=Chondromyces apiculatus DSM 436 TaxID=1192034 RepID=A0A017SYG3_9BACT|nr:hypothetical protein [Chondromyces apiculatus]EYF01817.1 Hypothetical protein CAP_7770 [Chondromyces apiculatus DSM 436]
MKLGGAKGMGRPRARTAVRFLGGAVCAALLSSVVGASVVGCGSDEEGDGSGGGGQGGQGGQGTGGDGAGGGGQGGQGGGSDERYLLRVQLYPYIPDAAEDQFAGMLQRLESEFEALHPEVDLDLNPPCFVDDIYDPEAIGRGLSGEGSACLLELAEVDTSLLGEVVATGAARPWGGLPQDRTFHAASITASTHEGALYGVPHWMCGHFVFSRDAAVAGAQTVDALVQALDDLQTPGPNMAGTMLGSWNLPSLYLDAWADTNGPEGVASAISDATYDPATLEAMMTFASTCESNGENPCLNGTYDPDAAGDPGMALFAAGEADAAFGFSERLHTILKGLPVGSEPEEIQVSSAPIGDGNHPLLFTDSFVLSARCTGGCADAAEAFVAYMSLPSTYGWVLSSEDAPEATRVPRYLMAPVLEAYERPELSADPFYPRINALTAAGTSFPNVGLYPVKDAMRDDLLATLAPDPAPSPAPSPSSVRARVPLQGGPSGSAGKVK